MLDPDAMLAAIDDLRGSMREKLPEGAWAERDGPLVRTVGQAHGGFVQYSDLGGLEGAGLDALIQRQVRYFAERGEPFEWKLYGHDLPADLPDRLRAAGFVSEPQETVVVAPAVAIAREADLPAGVTIREADEADLARIAALEARIWDEEFTGLAETLAAQRALDADSLTVYVAEAGTEVVCAAWVRFSRGAPFAALYGGATLPDWRGRGIYRALVATRARLAAERGVRYLLVDASDDSRPILERLGFVAITTTTPFQWTPPEG
jgi:ribosomal protein S18 acetylase RimI-like enzyme